MPCYQCSKCGRCGMLSTSADVVCGRCGAPTLPGQAFCEKCGAPLGTNGRGINFVWKGGTAASRNPSQRAGGLAAARESPS
ncbi:MAG: zinc-ribbon domain-containing protein [Coriobacteriales bacterium]